MRLAVGIILFALGALISLGNFYLSFARVPLGRVRGRETRWVSGVPLLGSLLLVVAAVVLRGRPIVASSALAVAAIDTGGLHWFLATVVWHEVIRRPRRPGES